MISKSVPTSYDIEQCIICIMGKKFKPLHGGETGRKCVSDIAEFKDYIVNTMLRIFGPDFQVSQYICIL